MLENNEFVRLVKQMRDAQKEYFKSMRNYDALKRSKNLEKLVDIEIAALTGETLL